VTAGRPRNPYHVRLSELERFRPMTASGHSPLDPADDEDLLPTSTGQIADEPRPRPSMLLIEGEIWAIGEMASYATSTPGPRATLMRWFLLSLLIGTLMSIAGYLAGIMNLF
jgi:hypothetical protein